MHVTFSGAEKFVFKRKQGGVPIPPGRTLARIMLAWKYKTGTLGFPGEDGYYAINDQAPQINKTGKTDLAFQRQLNAGIIQGDNSRFDETLRQTESIDLAWFASLFGSNPVDKALEQTEKAFHADVCEAVDTSGIAPRVVLVARHGKKWVFEEQA